MHFIKKQHCDEYVLNHLFKSECHGKRFGTLNVGSLCGRKTEVCEELRKRKVDVCCIQEVRWKGLGARFVGTLGRRYQLWWSGNDAGFGGVGILVKEEISGNVVEVRRKSDRVMAIVLTLGREVMRVICAYGPQSGRPDAEKVRFYDEMGSEWDLGSSSEIIVSLGDFNGHVGKYAEGFEGVHGEMVLGKEMQKEEVCWSFVMRKSCAWQILGLKRQTKGKSLIVVVVDVEQKLILCLWQKNTESIIRDVKVIPWELQHRMAVVDLDKKVLKKVMTKERIIRRQIWKLNENQTRVRFEKRVKELVSTDAPDLWKTFRDGVLKACDELCVKKKSRRDQGDMWWWNDEVKDTITRKKAAFKELCRFPSEQNKTQYKRIRNQTKKIVARAMRMEAN